MVGWAAALRRELGHYHSGDARQPVVELYLIGTLPFARSALDIRAVEALLEETLQPLVGLVKDFTQAADVLIETGETMTRQTLEKHVLSSLFRKDPSLAPQSDARHGDCGPVGAAVGRDGGRRGVRGVDENHDLCRRFTGRYPALCRPR
jgi:hypothetical protein